MGEGMAGRPPDDLRQPSSTLASPMTRHYLIVLRPPRPTFPGDATEAEAAAVGRHFEHLKALMEQGTLWFAGRCEDAEFGLALIEAGSQEEAESIAAADPAVQAGVFTSTLHPFRASLWKG